jgi:glutaconate CoA-transferase, subunit B
MVVISEATEVYRRSELMVIEAARALRDHDVVFVGIGLPNLACNLAKRLHAPALQMVYEAGIVGSEPERQALSIGDPCLVTGAAAVTSLSEVFLFFLQRGLIDVGFLGGAQVDRHGNLNTTVIGDYSRPTVRLPGSGGASDIATLAKRVFIIGRQTRRTFVERVGFVTSPGYLPGGDRPPGTPGRGPQLVVTDLGVYHFGEDGEMAITSLHPDVTPDDVRRNTGWDIVVPDGLPTTPAPTHVELRVLREDLDPNGHYLKGERGQ